LGNDRSRRISPIAFVSAKVPCLITQRTFSQSGGNGSRIAARAILERRMKGRVRIGN
jgi:hypothetical protein